MIPAHPQVSVRRLAALSLIVGLALGASGCGRYGPLEPPNSSAAAAPAQPSDDPLTSVTHHKEAPITPPKAPFVLDPIL
ncbi:MAG: hypothetical protein ABSC25_15635 [Roseiarcus sp.]